MASPAPAYVRRVPTYRPAGRRELGMGIQVSLVGIARICHEAMRHYCMAIGDPVPPSWEDAPEYIRTSAHSGVKFYFDNPDAGPEAVHESWLTEKEREGWKYGPAKDEEKKEHPCFVEYADLPEKQKAKDYIFVGIVEALLDR